MREYDKWSDKISVALKGPGWTPGKPRLGDINDVPEVQLKYYYIKAKASSHPASVTDIKIGI